MLLYPYLHQVGAEDVFATLTGAPLQRPGRVDHRDGGLRPGCRHRRGDQAFASGRRGCGSRTGCGPAADDATGTVVRTGRRVRPLALQRAFAAGMLAADPAPDPVYFVDDHFVAYSGARPVAKGWNTKRRHAQPGRDDTLLVDARGRVGRGGVWCSSPWR